MLLPLLVLAWMTPGSGQQRITDHLERIELVTLRIQKDLIHTPDRYFDTPASGFILKAIDTSDRILDEFENITPDKGRIIEDGYRLKWEIEKANQKGNQPGKDEIAGPRIQVMFFSTGS